MQHEAPSTRASPAGPAVAGRAITSPLLNGGRVYGDVDTATGLTFGFDRSTGLALPGTAMHEGDVSSVLAQALDIDFAGRLDIPVMVRSS
jgi:hypothetical protein